MAENWRKDADDEIITSTTAAEEVLLDYKPAVSVKDLVTSETKGSHDKNYWDFLQLHCCNRNA